MSGKAIKGRRGGAERSKLALDGKWRSPPAGAGDRPPDGRDEDSGGARTPRGGMQWNFPCRSYVGFAEQQLKGAFMAKRATKKSAKKPAAKKRAAKRELISPRGDKRFIRRDAAGRIKESDDVSRSLSQDRRKKAMKAAKSGQGDRGDRKPASKAPARKKTRAKR
jgi:hypothetical protein